MELTTGIYNLENATELDNVAYSLYLDTKELGDTYMNQHSFCISGVGNKYFYTKAKELLRSKKINKIVNENK